MKPKSEWQERSRGTDGLAKSEIVCEGDFVGGEKGEAEEGEQIYFLVF